MLINYTTGYAGTGKSTKLLEKLDTINIDTAVVVTPTHKALQRLARSTSSSIEMKTIHALLGWVPRINDNAETVQQIDSITKLNHPLDEYTNIIIDEAGMMGEDMFLEIISKLEEANDFETEHITLSLFLDPYQLLPVKSRQIQIDPDTTTNLTTQYRSDSPDVVALYTKFVHYLTGENSKDLRVTPSENVVYVDSLADFREGDRLLAYTNKTVGSYNTTIAAVLGIDTYINQEVQLGSKPDTYKVDSFANPSVPDLIRAFDNKTLMLQDSKIDSRFVWENMEALVKHPNIEFIVSSGRLIPVIIGIGVANEVIKEARSAAIKNRKLFRDVYALNRAFIMDYTFASTVHKAQGSEFERVWIDKKDIFKSVGRAKNYSNYARMMYVAISRAKHTVFVVDF